MRFSGVFVRIGGSSSGYEGVARALPAPKVERVSDEPRENPARREASPERIVTRVDEAAESFRSDYEGLPASSRRALRAYQSTAALPENPAVEVLGLQIRA